MRMGLIPFIGAAAIDLDKDCYVQVALGHLARFPRLATLRKLSLQVNDYHSRSPSLASFLLDPATLDRLATLAALQIHSVDFCLGEQS
jgi:hypothetical protein